MRWRICCVVERDVDLLIVGGGVIGLALMHALKPLGYRVLLLCDQPFGTHHDVDFDARSLALSPASICILDRIGVWPLLQTHATFIEAIHISEQGAFGQARLVGEKQRPLGAVVEMNQLKATLESLIEPSEYVVSTQLMALD